MATATATETNDATATAYVNGKDFVAALRKVARATDSASTRYALGSILIELREGVLHLVATDGRRLHCWRNNIRCVDNQGDARVLFSPKDIASVAKLAIDKRTIFQLTFCGARLTIADSDGDGVFVARFTSGRFPDWRQACPTAFADEVECERMIAGRNKDIRKLFERLPEPNRELFAEPNVRRGKRAIVQSKPTVASEKRASCEASLVDGKFDGLSLNPQYMRDALAGFKTSATVRITQADEDGPVTVSSPSDTQFRAVVMPLAKT